MKKHVIFIESNTTGTGEIFAQNAKKLGYCPVLITSDINRYSSYFKNDVEVILAQTNTISEVLELCRRLKNEKPGLVGVFSSSEYYIYTAAIVAEQLGLPGPSSTAITITRDKYLQRKRLQHNGVSVPKFAKVTTPSEASSNAESIGFPVVVKPVLSSGSEGVKLCKNMPEVERHAEKLLNIKTNPRGQPNPDYILVEELMVGQEFSVESFADKNGINVVGITKKYLGEPPNFLEIGHDYPALIDKQTASSISDTAIKALQAVGLTWGPTHTEIKLTQKGPQIVEINPRLAGGMIPKLVHLAMDIDLITLTSQLICDKNLTFPKKIGSNYASIRFLIPPENGIIKQINGIQNAEKTAGIVDVTIYEKAKQFQMLKGDFNDRVGHVISSCASIHDCQTAVAKALNEIKFVMS